MSWFSSVENSYLWQQRQNQKFILSKIVIIRGDHIQQNLNYMWNPYLAKFELHVKSIFSKIWTKCEIHIQYGLCINSPRYIGCSTFCSWIAPDPEHCPGCRSQALSPVNKFIIKRYIKHQTALFINVLHHALTSWFIKRKHLMVHCIYIIVMNCFESGNLADRRTSQ